MIQIELLDMLESIDLPPFSAAAAANRVIEDRNESLRLARKSDPETSKEAAARVKEFKARDAALIYAALSKAWPDGMTKDEMSVTTKLDATAVARRMREMARDGLVSESGKTRAGFKGRKCTVWIRK